MNKLNKTLIDERTKQKQKGHEYGRHHFPLDINIHYTAIRMSWRLLWFQHDSGFKKIEKRKKRLSSLINLIRASSIMDVSNHESGNLLSCCVKDSPLRRGLYLIDLHPTIFNGLSRWAAAGRVCADRSRFSHRLARDDLTGCLILFRLINSFYVLLLMCAQKGPLV